MATSARPQLFPLFGTCKLDGAASLMRPGVENGILAGPSWGSSFVVLLEDDCCSWHVYPSGGEAPVLVTMDAEGYLRSVAPDGFGVRAVETVEKTLAGTADRRARMTRGAAKAAKRRWQRKQAAGVA